MRAPAWPRSANEWNTGFKKGTFATVACPAWMMGYIQGQAPEDQGQVGHRRGPRRRRQLGRLVPDRPEAAQHQKEAYELAKFLTAPEQQA